MSENSRGAPYLPMWPVKPLQPSRLVQPGQPLRPPQPRPPPPPYPAGATNQLIRPQNAPVPANPLNSAPPHWPDLNKQLSECLEQIKDLQEKNKQLKHDNQELRDLCCFLDDDRQRARKLAKEWQKFGRYTAKVMRQEVCFSEN